MARVASFHLVRHGRAIAALASLGSDRRHLRRAAGLAFWRLLGTGRASDTAASIDPRRTAMFAVWNDERDLEEFLRASPVARRWAVADECWHVRLRALGGHGAWRGVDVLGEMSSGTDQGAIAVLTRAEIRWPHRRAFRRAARSVSAELQAATGLLAAVGIGETPIGRLGTFSVWRGLDDVGAFTTSRDHLDAVRRTRRERWYGEELFVRFEPYGSSGSWDGGDPLVRS